MWFNFGVSSSNIMLLNLHVAHLILAQYDVSLNSPPSRKQDKHRGWILTFQPAKNCRWSKSSNLNPIGRQVQLSRVTSLLTTVTIIQLCWHLWWGHLCFHVWVYPTHKTDTLYWESYGDIDKNSLNFIEPSILIISPFNFKLKELDPTYYLYYLSIRIWIEILSPISQRARYRHESISWKTFKQFIP